MTEVMKVLVNVYGVFTLFMLVVRFERGLLLLIPIVPLAAYTYRTPVMGLNLTNLLVYTAFSMGLLRRIGHRGPVPPATWPLVVFFGMTIFSWLIGWLNFRHDAVYPYETLRWFVNIERWVLYTLLYFAYFFGWSEKIPLRTGFQWMLVGVFIAAAYNLYELAFPTPYLLASGRAGGVFVQANANGIFLASYGLLPLVFAATTTSAVRRWLYWGVFGLCVIGVVVSASRAALLCLGAAGLVFAFFRSRRAFAALVVLIGLLVPAGSIFLPKKVFEHYESTLQGSEYEGVAGKFEGSAANRIVQNIAGVKLFFESPIVGHGLGGFYYRSPKYLPPGSPSVTRAPHSTFLALAVEGGIIWLGAFLVLLTSLGLSGKRMYDLATAEEDRLFSLFLIAIVVTKIIANFLNIEFLSGDASCYLWVTAALVSLAYSKLPERSPARQPVPTSWRPRARPEVRPPVMHG